MSVVARANKAKNFDFQEGVNILRVFRALEDEEQRIAYAILEGMRLQKALDSQEQSTAGA